MKNIESNTIVTIDKLIICFKSKNTQYLIDLLNMNYLKKNEIIELSDSISLFKNYSKTEKDVTCSFKYNLHYCNQKVGILFFGTENREDFYLKIFNEVFYKNVYTIKFIISLVLNNFPVECRINNISKLDIAADTTDSYIRNNATIVEDQCLNNSYFSDLKFKTKNSNFNLEEYNGRTLKDAIYKLSVPNLKTRQDNGSVHIGTFKNKKSITIYFKHEKQHTYQKSYFDTHLGYGHDPITRLEIRLKSSFFIKNDFDLNKVDDCGYITEYFKKVTEDYLNFKIINKPLGFDNKRNRLYERLNFLYNFQFLILQTKEEDFIINIDKETNTGNVVKQNRSHLTKLLKQYASINNQDILDKIIEFVNENKLSYGYNKVVTLKDKQHFFDFLFGKFEIVVKKYDYNHNLLNKFSQDLKIRVFPRSDKRGNQILTNVTTVRVNIMKGKKYGIEFTKIQNL